jgi:hypothetical protein
MIPGSSHTFQVRAEDPSGNHSFSTRLTVSFAAGDNTPPTAPSNLRVVSNTASGVELAWDPSADASDFDSHVAGAPCSPWWSQVTRRTSSCRQSKPIRSADSCPYHRHLLGLGSRRPGQRLGVQQLGDRHLRAEPIERRPEFVRSRERAYLARSAYMLGRPSCSGPRTRGRIMERAAAWPTRD